jgi:hypothetical protein
MTILNFAPQFPYSSKAVYYVPSKNVNGSSVSPMTDEQIQEGDSIHYGASHSVNGRMRKNKRDGDVEIVSTSTSGFTYSWSSYTPLSILKTSFESDNKVLIWLQENSSKISELAEFCEKPVIKDRTSFGHWEMKNFKGFPVSVSWDSSDINPPVRIRYASTGVLSDDVCFWDGEYLTFIAKGTEIEFGVN